MDDCYDTFYISFKLSDVYGGSFLEDLFLQVSSFGSLYEFSPLPGILNAYSCRYCNIRTAFEVRRLSEFQVGPSSVTISGSLIELHERSFECPILDINGEPIDLSDPSCRIDLNAQEWNKYQQLKHRRLASIPFSLCGVPERNRVVIERIQTGEDLRTTMMIRNIPNKVTFDELKKVIDETSKGEYDFLCK
ncbi:DEKNAAC105146 [Brettanomyces naardenensis]|uniref:DEKNAAC105146 n=1 Tax=Brettanomyces naardenensis TaxID=13370 RepID=A0A448YT51_BRENA|nr:DEKNAAC105146 [Brettanomyces naardenensis]